jgi:polyisoprenoid-binding protein YceI
MNKYWIVIIFAVGFSLSGYTQAYVTKNGMIRFYSETQMEKIEAVNRQVNAALLTQTGDFVFKVLMKSFNFEKAMIQEHFNENYLESDKYPEATFLGKITNIKDINFTKEGSYPATVEGKLTIHGQTQPLKQNGTFEIKNEAITAKAKFNILLADYKISIPATLVNNISKSIVIDLEVILAKYNK